MASTVSTNGIYAGVDGTAWVDAGDTSIPQACHVYGIYLSLYAVLDGTEDANTPIVDWYVSFNPGTALTMPEPGATGGNEFRRFILHEGKGLLSFDSEAGPRKLFEGVIKIPRKFQRIGRDDALQLRILTENHAGFFCMKSIFKFYR